MNSRSRSPERPRSLPISEWPIADQHAWEDACRPGARFKRGGAASYLADVSRADIANRYGAYLGFLQRTGRLDYKAPAGSQVTSPNVEAYLADLQTRGPQAEDHIVDAARLKRPSGKRQIPVVHARVVGAGFGIGWRENLEIATGSQTQESVLRVSSGVPAAEPRGDAGQRFELANAVREVGHAENHMV